MRTSTIEAELHLRQEAGHLPLVVLLQAAAQFTPHECGAPANDFEHAHEDSEDQLGKAEATLLDICQGLTFFTFTFTSTFSFTFTLNLD